jgi:tetratricopeptide (TPR) repeat protein
MPVALESTPRTRMSRRHTRIVWTASTLIAIAFIGGVVAWRIQRDREPEAYTPGEASTDITTQVSDRAAKTSVAAPVPSRVSVTSRIIDPLVNTNAKLPPGAPQPFFTDVTKTAGLAQFRQFNGNRTSQLPEDMGSGVAWGDFDNDGFDDLFVVSAGGPLGASRDRLAPSLLYRNRGDGSFELVKDFPDIRILGMGAAWGDYNNDGWLDLAVTGYDSIQLFRNDRGHFVLDRAIPSEKGFWTGVSWGDYDRNGYLDLYVCGYVKYARPGDGAQNSTQQFGLEVPFTLNPSSYEPERNLLFRNNGNGTFTEVAKQLGVSNPEGRSLSALWHDFDGNGWLDLYIANDVSENKLFLNQGGRFTDAGRSAWVEEYRGSMGLAAGDFDRDGDDDLFITHWIAQQFALYQSLSVEEKHAAASKPALHFTDVAEMLGIGQPSRQMIGWGASFIDFDSDGWPDLAVANGSTFEEKGGAPKKLAPMPSFLFWNMRGQYFHDLAPWNRSASKPHVSRGLAAADYDNDGSMDIAIVDHGEGVRLLRNDVPHGNWIEVRLHSRVPGAKGAIGFGDGATVIAWTNRVEFRRTVSSSSYLSQDSRRVHIGLGAASKVDRLEVQWLGGRTETWTALDANRIWEITEGVAEARVFGASPPVPAVAKPLDKAALASFWTKQRAAMDAMKRERDLGAAARLLREALAINPAHEDSRYYLANCLASAGDTEGAVAELDTLARINPQSRRAFQRKGELLAASAASSRDFDLAKQALGQALRINPEETGALTLLGEVELAAGDPATAERHFSHACQANARATTAWFLRAYIAWTRSDSGRAAQMLRTAHESRGKDWKPSGAALEGDVKQRMFREAGFLNIFEREWDGTLDPSAAFGRLHSYLMAAPHSRAAGVF